MLCVCTCVCIEITDQGDSDKIPCAIYFQIEETILGYLAWKSDSPLFNAIDAAGSVPTYQEVLLPDGPAMGYSPFQSRVRGSGRGL